MGFVVYALIIIFFSIAFYIGGIMRILIHLKNVKIIFEDYEAYCKMKNFKNTMKNYNIEIKMDLKEEKNFFN